MQQTQDVKLMFMQCWTIVCYTGPALKQHWFNVSSFLQSILAEIDRLMLQCIVLSYSSESDFADVTAF